MVGGERQRSKLVACGETAEAWFMDENSEDQRLPHQKNPSEFLSMEKLAELGVLYWKLNPNDYENDEELKKIRERISPFPGLELEIRGGASMASMG
ncbi:1,2-dihydroxy-3-keto-5-methylthiopentene dioxygenase 2 [Capsicum annuum]|nr:1,2-dihydroxy-3-keto-5-methylthiopentene dioxygenase 2 [Capsicum annuum]